MSDSGVRRIGLSEPVIAGREWEYVKECLDTGWLSAAGRFVGLFEDRIRETTGAAHAVAVMNGTSGLHLSLVMRGVGPGDEVLIPTITFIAPVNAIRYTGAEPVFMDCDEHLNIDAEKVGAFLAEECSATPDGLVNRSSGRRVRAIIPVHVFGAPCDMGAIMELAERYGLDVIEDASEALGSTYTDGPLAGSYAGAIAPLGVLSFNTNKIITTGGGGMLLLHDAELAERARYLCAQAKDDPVRYRHEDVGYNYRLTNIEAAIGVAQLEDLGGRVERRRAIHSRYTEGLGALDGIEVIGSPGGTRPNGWLSAVWVDPARFGADAEGLMTALDMKGVQARPVWQPNHLQTPYAHCQAYRIERAVHAAGHVLNLPSGSGLSDDAVEYVIESIKEVHER